MTMNFNIKLFGRIFTLSLFLVLFGCDEQGISVPDYQKKFELIDFNALNSGSNFQLMVNDPVVKDSVNTSLARGVFITTQPFGEYDIEIHTNSEVAPEINLFKLHDDGNVYANSLISLEANNSSSPYQYFFKENDSEITSYIMVVSDGITKFNDAIEHIYVNGLGPNDSTSLKLNLIVVGEHGDLDDGEEQDELSQLIFSQFNTLYNMHGVTISEINVLKAEDNPLYGYLFPQDQEYSINLEEYEDVVVLSSWPNDKVEQNALDLVLIHHYTNAGLMGLSPLPGRSLGDGLNSVVVITSHRIGDRGFTLIENSYSAIANTAAHEAGHFLGLRHTIATKADQAYDHSIVEDGLNDTPYDRYCNVGEEPGLNDRYYAWIASVSSLGCEGEDNLMFPVGANDDVEYSLSVEQGNILRRNLSLYEH